MSRRKILPKKEVRRYDSVDFVSHPIVSFNDQKTIEFVSGTIIDMPSGLPKDYVLTHAQSYPGVELLSDLSVPEISGVYVTGSVISSRLDNFIRVDPLYSASLDPFSEQFQPEQGNFLDPFFATGSIASIGEVGSFSAALKDKIQIRLTIPVKQKTKMLPNSSSIYYLDVNNGTWSAPPGATFGGPFDAMSFRAHSLDQYDSLGIAGSPGSTYIEDKIGFDAYGNPTGVGNNYKWPTYVFDGSEIGEDSLFDKTKINEPKKVRHTSEYFGKYHSFGRSNSEILASDYGVSAQRNTEYDASNNQTFTLPIDYPFLVEKMVIDLPFCFGNGWFYDKTISTVISVLSTDYLYSSTPSAWDQYTIDRMNGFLPLFDSGGPGVTISLFSEVPSQYKFRDLIASCMIDHNYDAVIEPVIKTIYGKPYNNPDPDISGISPYQNISLYSCLTGTDESNSENIGCYVTASVDGFGNRFFTGSVQLRMTPSISNGSTLTSISPTALSIINGTNLYDTLLKNKYGGFYTWLDWYPHAPSDRQSYDDIAYKFFQDVLGSEYISAPMGGFVHNVDAFGRAMTGFAPSGGSVFGKEFSTNQTYKPGSLIKNPFYVENAVQRGNILLSASSSISDPSGPIAGFGQVWTKSLGTKIPSPFLVVPGQKLILAASKTRPAHDYFSVNITDVVQGLGTLLSSSYFMYLNDPEGHDVTLNTGSINITFYGSYVKSNSGYVP